MKKFEKALAVIQSLITPEYFDDRAIADELMDTITIFSQDNISLNERQIEVLIEVTMSANEAIEQAMNGADKQDVDELKSYQHSTMELLEYLCVEPFMPRQQCN